MSQPPKSGHVYFIVNKKLPLVWDLSNLEKNFVVGTPLKKAASQKVRSTAIDDPSILPS